jgi:hypothetical protein
MSTVTIQNFRGLDLSSDAEEATGAIDMLNVDLDKQGRLRARDGYSKFTSVAGTNAYDSLIAFIRSPGLTFEIIAGAGNRLEAISSAGIVTASSVAPTASPHFFVRWGSPTAEYIYIANGTDQIRRWDGTNFTSPAGLAAQTGRLLAVQTPDNRLVHACSTTNPSRVAFSDAGNAESFGANNYVDVRPGDGERITALVQWRNMLFAFKQTSFAVFYGNSTDSSGNPVFNYRTVEGAGCLSFGGACAGPDGVYFIGEDGIYRTTGGVAVSVSDRVEPLLRNGADLTLFAGTQSARSVRVNQIAVPASLYGRLYFPLRATAGGAITLVYDPQTGQWGYWLFNEITPYFATAPHVTASVPDQLLWPGTGSKHIFSQVQSSGGGGLVSTTDDGTAIVSRYRTGFMDLGAPEQEKWIRQMMLTGTGTVNVKTAVNDGSTLSSATSVAMGTSPAVGTGRWSAGTRGRNISVDISATSGAWSLSHLSLDVAATRAPGVRAA